MGNFEKIFREYLILNESRIISEPKPFKDAYIGGNYLLRQYEKISTIHFLTSPDSIIIPNLFIDIFTGFNTEYSGQIGELLMTPDRPDDKLINRTIRYSLCLARDIQSNMLYYKTNTILGSIEKLVDLGGLSRLRELIKELTGLTIDPWRIENLNKSIEI